LNAGWRKAAEICYGRGPDDRDQLLQVRSDEAQWAKEAKRRQSAVKKFSEGGAFMWKEFREFIARGNVIDLAVAVIIGAIFGKIVTSLVEGIIMPPIGLILRNVDFASLFYVLDGSKGVPASLAEAKAKGIPVIAYGQFINDIINFLIVAFVVFLLVRAVNRLKSKEEAPGAAPTTKDCPYCFSAIPLKATRCAQCTSDLKAA
jgi:large conductance mechanosensitive channel